MGEPVGVEASNPDGCQSPLPSMPCGAAPGPAVHCLDLPSRA